MFMYLVCYCLIDSTRKKKRSIEKLSSLGELAQSMEPTMGRRCLSDLSDDLLRRILYFAQAKEAASTSALSQRFHALWLSSGAVNIDSRFSYNQLNRYNKRNVIMRDIEESVAAHGRVNGCPIRKLTFQYMEGEDDDPDHCHSSSYDDDMYYAKRDMAGRIVALLRSPSVAGHVEELRVGLFYGPCPDMTTYLYELDFGTLPSMASLRKLHLSKCMDLPFDDGPTSISPSPFPNLTELRLHLCYMSPHILQAVMDATPLLATLILDGVVLSLHSRVHLPAPRSLGLRCPDVLATLVLANLYCEGTEGENTIEIEAPALRRFAYEGPIRSLSVRSSGTITRVDLRLHVPAQVDHADDGTTCQLFWRFVHSFGDADIFNLSFQLPPVPRLPGYCC